MDLDEFVESTVRDLIKDSVPAHKRRVAIRQGNREPETAGCDHADWDHVRSWCNGCGLTRFEMAGGRYE